MRIPMEYMESICSLEFTVHKKRNTQPSYQKTYETGDLANVKQYVQRFLTYPDGKEYANATDEVKMNATMTMELMYPDNKLHWTLYVDPITSLVLTGLILYTTLGLLKGK